jgi:glycosyltransferase involved in cell wall biosynthesis
MSLDAPVRPERDVFDSSRKAESLPPRSVRQAPSTKAKSVAMMVPGGLEHSGGIGRWAGYVSQAWTNQNLSPPLEIIDTRGFGGPAVGVKTFLQAVGRLTMLAARGRLGIVHANLSIRGSTIRKCIIAVLARMLGVPVVVHLHGSGYPMFYKDLPPWAKRPVRALFAHAVHVIVLGRFWADWVADNLDVPREKITILYNGVSSPENGVGASGSLARKQEPGRPCHIVLLGRIGARKGVPELLQALSSDGMRERNWRATLAGDGEVDVYSREASARGLDGRVAFTGWLDGPGAAALIADADILVLPSHAENFPISVIEGLANEVAVVTTPIGTTPELLTHDESVLFVPVGDAPALATALAALIDDPELRGRIAAAGHKVFMDKLDIDVLAARLADLHTSLVERQR